MIEFVIGGVLGCIWTLIVFCIGLYIGIVMND